MELGSATFACSRTEESNSSSTLSSFSASPAHHEQMITLMPSTKITIGPLSEESNSSSPLSICSASPAHHEQLITLMPSTKVFNKDSVERINNVIKAEDGITPSTQSTSSCMAQSSYPKCSSLNWFPRKRTESYLERKIRMLQEKEGTNATLDETLGDSNLHLPRIEREKLAAQTAARVAMEAHKAALVEASWCRILKAARIQCTLAEVQLKKAEQKAAEAFDSAAAVRVIIDNNPGGPKQSLEIETSTTDGRSTHTVSASLETVFEVEKEVAEAVKVAFFRLAHLPSSSIKDIFNANDDACKRASINLDENAVKFNNDSDSKDFSSEACSESEAQTGGEHQTDSELERDADATAPETNCIQIRKNVAKALVQKHRHHPKHHHSNRQPPKEIIVSEELIDLMLGRVKLLKEEELVSLAMIVATRGLSAMLKEDNKEQELNGKCSSGGLGDILVKHVSRLEAEKSAAAAAASKVVVVPRDNRRELTSEILPDLGSILVKHVSKFESEVQEAKRLAKAIKSEDNRNLGELKEHGESLFEDSTKDNSFETNPELRRSFVKHAELMIHVSEKTTKLAESEQQNAGSLDANLLEKIHVSEREQFTATGERCAKMLQPKSGLSKKQSMETDVNLADDIDTEYDKENRDDINIYSTENKTLEMKSKFDILNNNSLDKMKKSNFNSTASGSDLSTIPLKHVTELEQGILAAKSALDVVERVQRKQNHHNGNSEEGLDKILVKHVSKLEKEKLAAAALSNEASGSMQGKKQLRCVKREESLDKDLVKHISKLEKEKLAAAVFSNEASTTGVQRRKQHHYVKDEESLDKVLIKHISKLEKEKMAASALTTNLLQNVDRKHQLHDTVEESLDKVLVKHISKLEKERLAALASEKESFQRVQRSQNCCDRKDGESLENILIKHISKLEREKIAASELTSNSLQNVDRKYQLHDTVEESLDKVLVKHISKLEKEKLAALASEKESFQRVQRSPNHCDSKDGESLENVLVKHISKLEKAKLEAVQEASERVQKSQRECDGKKEDSLDKVLVKHVSRLEREKNMAAAQEAFQRVQRNQRQSDEGSIESLDKILVKHLSQLEKEKQRASTKGSDVLPQSSMSQTRDQAVQLSHTAFGPMVGEMSRIDIEKQETTIANVAGGSVLQRHRNARAHEIQEAWGGFSLGNSLRRHMSQLEIEKAAWHRAEEEARMRASQY